VRAASDERYTFRDRQAQNRRRTLALLVSLSCVAAATGWVIELAVLGARPGGNPPLPIASVAALAGSAALACAAYFRGARVVQASLHGESLRLSEPEHRQLDHVVAEIALAAGLPKPAVFVIPDPSPNALATGRDPEHAAIGITEGALLLLDREETQGVIAHEMAHIANRDTLTMTAVAVLLGAVVLLADWGQRTLLCARPRTGRAARSTLLPLALLAIAIAPLLSRLLAMAVSREREYLADATAVELTRNPLGLARALEHIGSSTSPLRRATRGTAHLFISDPLHRGTTEREGRLANLLSTHPPLRRRIAILKAMAGAPTYE